MLNQAVLWQTAISGGSFGNFQYSCSLVKLWETGTQITCPEAFLWSLRCDASLGVGYRSDLVIKVRRSEGWNSLVFLHHTLVSNRVLVFLFFFATTPVQLEWCFGYTLFIIWANRLGKVTVPMFRSVPFCSVHSAPPNLYLVHMQH